MRKLYVLAVLMCVSGCVPPEGEQASFLGSTEQSATSGCYVTVYCSDGTSRTCSGASACSAAPTASPPSVTCDGVSSTCSTTPPPSGCTISGVTYSAGTVHPSNICQVCDPARSTTSWSNRDSLVLNYNCKENFETCIEGPCGGNWCDSDAYCSARCVGGQFICAMSSMHKFMMT